MWMFSSVALCLPAMSQYSFWAAPHTDMSRYSLYMLWMPDRDRYFSQNPKFLCCPAHRHVPVLSVHVVDARP